MDGYGWGLLFAVAFAWEIWRVSTSEKARRQYVHSAYDVWQSGCHDEKVLLRSCWLPCPVLLRMAGFVVAVGYGCGVLLIGVLGVLAIPFKFHLLTIGCLIVLYLVDVWGHRAAQIVLKVNASKGPC